MRVGLRGQGGGVPAIRHRAYVIDIESTNDGSDSCAIRTSIGYSHGSPNEDRSANDDIAYEKANCGSRTVTDKASHNASDSCAFSDAIRDADGSPNDDSTHEKANCGAHDVANNRTNASTATSAIDGADGVTDNTAHARTATWNQHRASLTFTAAGVREWQARLEFHRSFDDGATLSSVGEFCFRVRARYVRCVYVQSRCVLIDENECFL